MSNRIPTLDEIAGVDGATFTTNAYAAALAEVSETGRRARRAEALRRHYGLAAGELDSPELRAQQALEPLFVDAHRRAGRHLRTSEDVARDAVAARQRADAVALRQAHRQAEIAASYARNLSAAGVTR